MPLKKAHQRIGFVPTMGALHKGHLALILKAKEICDVVVCSIFVNPTQFTDPKDLEKYPRPIQSDIQQLQNVGCDFLFMPSVLEMYPKPEKWQIALGNAEKVLEGAFRPGHYQGVTQIVKKLFDAVTPDIAFFGQKDYQQVLMIEKLIEKFKLPVQLFRHPTIRETDGLAMSSRNVHLSADERKRALVLSKALFFVQNHFEKYSIPQLLEKAATMIRNEEGVELEYFAICNGKTLMPIAKKSAATIVALIAAKVGATRLIDNVIIKEQTTSF